MNKNNKERIAWIDSAKGVLILAVILGHALSETSYKSPFYHGYLFVFRLISLFHMPAFFIISGILFENNKWKAASPLAFVKRKFSKLIIPYLIFESIAIILFVFILRFKSLEQAMIDMLTLRCNLGADWFLVTMFLSSCLFYLITRMAYSKRTIFMIAILSIVFVGFCNRESFVFLLLERCLIAVCFLLVGYAGKEYLLITLKPIQMTLIMITMVAIVFLNGPVSMYEARVGNPLVFAIGAILGTMLILLIKCSKTNTTKVLAKLGSNSLIIMGVHQHVVYMIRHLRKNVYGLIPTALLFIAMLLYSTLDDNKSRTTFLTL